MRARCRRGRRDHETLAGEYRGQPGELGQTVEGQVQLGRRAPGTQVPDALREPGVEMAGAEQREERPRGIGVRNDGAGADRLAARELHTGDAVAVERDARDGAPVRTVAPFARAAAASASVTPPMPPSGSHGRFAASSDCPLSRCSSARTELFDRGPRFVPSTASRASAPFSSGVSKVSSSTSKTLMPAMRRNSRMSSRPRRRMSRPSIAAAIVSERSPPMIRGGRRPCCFARMREAQHPRMMTGQRGAVIRGHGPGLETAVVEHEVLALARQRHGLQVRARRLEPVRCEVELTPNRRIEQVEQVRARRYAIAGRELARDGRAADAIGGLQHQHLAPAFAKYAAHTRPLCPAPITTIRLRSVILPALRDEIWFAQVEQDLARGIRARRRHDAAARVRSGAAHVEALRRPAVLRETRERAVEQQLVHRQLALEDVALGEAHLVLELARRAHLDVADEAAGSSGCSARSGRAPCRGKPSRSSSVQSRPWIFGGTYCTNTDMKCLPGGAMVGSVIDGISRSRYGSFDQVPFFQSS